MADAPRVDLGELNRKDPCPCGSGKKVKRCHGASNFEPQRSYQVQGRPIVTTSTPDKTIWAVSSRVFFHRANMTFHEFLFHYLADLLNRKWIVAEGQKGQTEQHHIFKCYQSYERISKEARSGTSAKVFRMKPDGATTSLLTLAYDCYQMEHSGNAMPNSWKKRLRDKEAFQGVRYEILVAALFFRMGFKLDDLSKEKRDELKNASIWMPGWLSDMFWVKQPAGPRPDFGLHFWDDIKAQLPPGGLAKYLKTNIAIWNEEDAHMMHLLHE